MSFRKRTNCPSNLSFVVFVTSIISVFEHEVTLKHASGINNNKLYFSSAMAQRRHFIMTSHDECQQRKGATQIFHLLHDLAGRVKHLSPRTVGFALILPFNLFLWVDSGTLIDTKRSETKELSSQALLKYWNSRNSISCSQNSNRYSLKSFRFPRFCSDVSILEQNVRFWSQSRQQSTSQ